MSNANKFIDRNPTLVSAGTTLKPSDGSIFLPPPRVVTPTHVSRMRAYQSAGVGTRRLAPSDIGADSVVHGVVSDKTQSVADVLSPPPKSFLQTVMESRKDQIYSSTTKPLGATASLKGIAIPDRTATFGVASVFDGSTAECLKCPEDAVPATRAPGVQTRRYGEALSHTQSFGKPSPHDDAGGNMQRSLRWVTEKEDEKAVRVRSKIDEDFHDRTDAPLGRSRSAGWPMPEPRPVPAPESAKNVMYMLSAPEEDLDADARRNRQHGVVTSARHKLKRAGFDKFGELEAAFRAHDVEQRGSIDVRRIPTVCRLFVLPLDESIVDEVCRICTVDGNVSYVDFVALLDYNRFVHTAPQAPATIRPTRAGGVPTIRADKAPPRIRRVCDFTNYGDEGDASSLLNPSTMAQLGVHARDLLCPRSQTEIRTLFSNLGVQLDDEQFAALWDRAARLTVSGEVSVESFRVALSDAA